jgi:hypothetical protein
MWVVIWTLLMRLPDLIVAGTRKCGTTWLHHQLAAHPSIFLPPSTKETFFFDRYWHRGVQWYADYFVNCPSGAVCAEISPAYFNRPQVPERMYQTLPQVKLVFMLRDPVQRAKSLYTHLRAKGDTHSSFEKALVEFPDMIDEGLYFKQIRRFEEVFGRKSYHVLVLEDLMKDAESSLRELYRFVGLPDACVKDVDL